MLERLYALLDALRRWLRLMAWAYRRRFLCPKGRHGNCWQYFGRSRVCRCCHREEWLSDDGWHAAPQGFAESRPSWHVTQPPEPGPIEHPNGRNTPTNGS